MVKQHESRMIRGRNRLAAVCAITVLSVLAATLWPFDPFPSNQAHWLGGTNGIKFNSLGVVISQGPLRAGVSNPQQSCALEILLTPSSVTSSSTIANFYTTSNPGQFLLRQWMDGLLMSHDTVGVNDPVTRSTLYVDQAFQVGKILLLTIVSGPNGTTVYKNGSVAKTFPDFRIMPSELTGRIVIGTSAAEYHPWTGEIHGLAIYETGLTPEQVLEHYREWTDPAKTVSVDSRGTIAFYRFSERAGSEIHSMVASASNLYIPKHFSLPQKAMLTTPAKEFEPNWAYVKDLLQNIAGFIPLGFVFYLYLASMRRRGKAILYSILSAATLSFTIEVLQAYIPQRVSGTTDIITNSLGAAIGASLGQSRVASLFCKAIDCCW